MERMMDRHSSSSASVRTSGGASRMMSPCVGLAKRPASRRRRQTSQASNSDQNHKKKVTP